MEAGLEELAGMRGRGGGDHPTDLSFFVGQRSKDLEVCSIDRVIRVHRSGIHFLLSSLSYPSFHHLSLPFPLQKKRRAHTPFSFLLQISPLQQLKPTPTNSPLLSPTPPYTPPLSLSSNEPQPSIPSRLSLLNFTSSTSSVPRPTTQLP